MDRIEVRMNYQVLRTLIFLVLFVLFFLQNTKVVFAQTGELFPTKQAIIVNPIRGGDFWEYKHSLLETPRFQYGLISEYNLPASWLVRYDALKNDEVVNFLKGLKHGQDVGIFLEVTPSLTKDSGVVYNESPNWHFAKSVLVTGYSPEDRRKMVDQVIKVFKEKLGYEPKSVGAWWIDAGTLSYMRDKYNIETNLDVADQYSTDGYQVWGQYWSTPYYPSKVNALMPAQSNESKIGVVTIQWATRDPFNGYGNGVFESTYSVQANDYLLHGLKTSYFEKLLSIYPQTTVGLENDFSVPEFGKEYENQVKILSQMQNKGLLQVKNMVQFTNYYKGLYPQVSPPVLISSDDPLGGEGKVVWFMSPKYRMGWFYGPYGSVIRDLRELNDSVEEACLNKKCEKLSLGFSSLQAIDEVNYQTRWVLDEGRISDFSFKNGENGAEFKYKNQSGAERVIRLFPNDIKIGDDIKPISTAILNITSNADKEIKPKDSDPNFRADFNWGKNLPPFLISSVKFISLLILFFLLPGLVLTKRWLISIPVGIGVFSILALLFGAVKFDLGLWLIPVVSVGLLIRGKFPNYENRISFDKHRVVLLIVVVLGSLSWLVTTIKNGLEYSYGLGFWGPNGHDGIWHLALISQLAKNVPPQNPVFSGEALQNYHYFFDLVLAKSSVILGINISDLLFRFFPVLISILIGLLTFTFVKQWVKFFKIGTESFARVAGIFGVFFVYFGGSFGWVMSYFKDKSFGGETTFWAQQATSTLLNPPYAISLVLLLAGMILLYEFLEKGKLSMGPYIALVILFGVLVEIKAYGGVLVILALGLLAAEKAIRKDFSVFRILIPAGVLSALVFLTNNSGSRSLFVFDPFWLVYSMLIFPDRLGWERMSFTIASGNPLKLLYAYGLGTIIFLTGNLWTRMIGFFRPDLIIKDRFLFWIGFLGIVIPLIFIQKGNSWNIVQFLYYSIFVFSLFAGISLAWAYFKLGSVAGGFLVFVIVMLTVPTSINNLGQYLPDRPPARLPLGELEGLKFLKSQDEGIVLSLPFEPELKAKFSEPLPLAAYAPTSYVSAYSGHQTFFEDTINLEIIGVDYKGRANLTRDFIRIQDRSKQILKENNIKYVYLLKADQLNIDEGRMGIQTIFENEDVKIYKVL